MGRDYSEQFVNNGHIGKIITPDDSEFLQNMINNGTIGGEQNRASDQKTTEQKGNNRGHDTYIGCTVLEGKHGTVTITSEGVVVDGTYYSTSDSEPKDSFGPQTYYYAYDRTATQEGIGLLKKITDIIKNLFLRKRWKRWKRWKR